MVSVDVRSKGPADAPSFQDMGRCVRCGYCLCECPTYLALGLETESPRGRLHLIRALTEGRVPPSPSLLLHLDLCVQCRACETACPSGVPFGRIMEQGRALVLQKPRAAPRSWRLRTYLATLLLPHPGRLRFLARLLYQRLGLQRLVRSTHLLRLLPGHLDDMEQFLPPLPDRILTPAPVTEPAVKTNPHHRVALLAGCITPILYPNLHEATVRVLARNGCQVLVPPEQTCCGALHAHAGDLKTARRLARRNIDVFLPLGVEAIVVNAAGCGSAMKEYGELLKDDPAYAEKAAAFSELVKDISEFLVGLPFDPQMGPVEERVTYQDSCHLAHAQGITAQPRALLQAIPGLDFIEMAHPDRCCGSGGIYNLTQPEMSWRLLKERMQEVAETKAHVVATANTGCMVQLEAGLRRYGPRGAQVAHVVELLDEAYSALDGADEPS
jgi:glycolate oxidase iron-sulfur subunit